MRQHAYCSFLIIFLLLLMEGCATPYVQPQSSIPTLPALHETHAIMDDGYHLPLTYWPAYPENKAIILALHGLNDYGNGFKSTGEYLVRRGISVIAYDQRGFGKSEGHGIWHGSNRMIKDLRTMTTLLQSQYPDKPLYLLGESMGGAVILAAMNNEPLATAGIILVAPAVWSRDSMPLYQRLSLWLAVHTIPSFKLTGEGLDLHPSDNIDMLRALGRDPLVIKTTRVDALYGISNLMDQAVNSTNFLNTKTLILYGKHDDIIPHEPTCQWLQSLPPQSSDLRQTVIYENGYHMLTRDLQANVVLKDISDWILGVDIQASKRQDTITVQSFCPETYAHHE